MFNSARGPAIRTTYIYRITVMLLLLSQSGCNIQGRLYRKGFYIERLGQRAHPSKKTNAEVAVVPERVTKKLTVLNEVPAFALLASGEAVTCAGDPLPAGRPVRQREQTTLAEHSLRTTTTTAIAAPGTRRKADAMGLIAFALSIGAWFTTGYFTLPLFVIASVLALFSLRRISNTPERFVLKTLSLIALILALVGTALSLFTLVLLVFS